MQGVKGEQGFPGLQGHLGPPGFKGHKVSYSKTVWKEIISTLIAGRHLMSICT